jgi:F420 biosynthesis protein FbiB-like protein
MTRIVSPVVEVMMARSSVRSFSETPIEPAIVTDAIQAASWAPSPHGTQPWRFVIVEEKCHRVGLAEAMAVSWQDQLRLDTEDEAVIAHRVQRSRDRLERAPVLVILCLFLGDAHAYPDEERQESETLMAVQSLGAAAQNFLLSIHEAGLASGWMCAPLFCPEIIREYLGLDAGLEPHALFPVGVMDSPPRRRERRPVEELIVRPNIRAELLDEQGLPAD